MTGITLNWANSYFDTRLYAELWTGDSVENETRTSALTMAESMIESSFRFPKGTFVYDEETELWSCDDRIKKAVCEQALWIIKYDPTDYPSILTKGFIEAETGVNTSITLDKTYIVPMICRAAIGLIGDLGELIDGAGVYRCRVITG